MRDYASYYKMMGENIDEKLDFIIDELRSGVYDRVIDFGCADGQTTRALAAMFPNIQFIGLDQSKDVIKANTKNNFIDNVHFLCSEDVANELLYTKNTLVIFSSVLHEVYSFLSADKIHEIFDLVSNAKAIAIRDMYFSQLFQPDHFFCNIVYARSDPGMLFEFLRSKQPDISEDYEVVRSLLLSNPRYMAEYLLKQRYNKSWEEELKENYFSVNWDELNSYLSAKGFHIRFKKLYMNAFLDSRLPLRYFTDTTHLKIIYKKNI